MSENDDNGSASSQDDHSQPNTNTLPNWAVLGLSALAAAAVTTAVVVGIGIALGNTVFREVINTQNGNSETNGTCQKQSQTQVLSVKEKCKKFVSENQKNTENTVLKKRIAAVAEKYKQLDELPRKKARMEQKSDWHPKPSCSYHTLKDSFLDDLIQIAEDDQNSEAEDLNKDSKSQEEMDSDSE